MSKRDTRVSTAVGRGFALFGRGFWPGLVVLAMLNLSAAALTIPMVTVVSELAWAQRDTVFADGELSASGVLLLFAQVGVPFGLLLAVLSSVGFVALAAVFGGRRRNDAGAGAGAGAAGASRLGIAGACVRGVRRALPFLGALAVAALEILLAFLLAPLISAVGIVLLLVFGVRALLGRPAASRWFGWPMLVAYAVPFGLAAVILVHSLLLLPVAAHERHGVRGLLRRSSELAGARPLLVTGLGLGGALLYAATVAGLSALALLGVPQEWVSALLLLAQFTVAMLPVALLVAAYFEALGGRVPPEYALPAPLGERRLRLGAVASTAAAALLLGFIVPAASPQVAWAEDPPAPASGEVEGAGDGEGDGGVEASGESGNGPSALSGEPGGEAGGDTGGEAGEGGGEEGSGEPSAPAPAWWSLGRPDPVEGRMFGSAACSDTLTDYEDQWGGVVNKPTLGMCVDSLGDEHDAAPGDGWCETSANTCTLRAAIEELSAWRSGHASIYLANASIAAGTVQLTAPLEPTTRFALHGSQDSAWNDLGSRLTIDGAGTVQLFRVTTGSGGGAELNDLTLTNGYAPSGSQGGAVQVLAGSVQLSGVTLDGNYAADAGAANAVYGSGADNPGMVRVDTSSLVNNGVPACHAPGFEVDGWQGPTTIDADDPSCPGTTSTATSLATSVSVYANPSAPKKGGPVTYHATVTKVQSGADELAGTVTFYVAGRDPLPVNVPADGQVSVSTTAAGADDYTVRAVYSGSQGYRGSQGETVITTNGTASAISLEMQSDDPDGRWWRGRPLTLTATVTSGADGGVADGEVVFKGGEGGGELGRAPIGADGRAVLQTTITTGDGEPFSGSQFRWWVQADYAGDATHDASSFGDYLYLARDETSVTVTPSQPSASPGETVTFTAKVMTQGPTPVPVTSGTVSFSGPGGATHTATPNAQGEATFTLTNLPYGTHGVSAQFGGAPARYADSWGSVSFPVTGKSAVRFDLAQSPATSRVGESPSWWVYLRPGAGVPSDGLPAPSGQLRLMLGDQLIAAGNTQLIATNLPVGTHTLRIEYDGDAVYLPHSQTVTHTVTKVPTTIYMNRSTSASVYGQPVDFSVTVSTSVVGQISQPVTEGEVWLTYRGSHFATIDLATGNSTTAQLPQILGDEPIYATYQGSDRFAAAQSNYATHRHAKADAQVALELDQATVPYTGAVQATVRVTGAAPSTLAPTVGTVELWQNGSPIAGTSQVMGSDGVVVIRLDASRLGAGTHSLEARFSGNPWFNDRRSTVASLVVEKHAPEVSLSASGGGQTPWGRSVTLEAAVSLPWAPNLGIGAADPLGTVTFVRVNGTAETVLGRVAVTEQQRLATLVVGEDQLPVGEHDFEARFAPSVETGNRLTFGTSSRVPHEVFAVPVELVMLGLESVLPGQPFTRTVQVREHPDFAAGATPEGSVRVSLDGVVLGDYPLGSLELNGHPLHIGYANVNFAATTPGPHTIAVEYLPATASPHAADTADFPFTAGAIGPEITLEADTRTIGWDEYLFVRASAVAPRPDLPAPRGKLVIGDGKPGGASCEINVVPGQPGAGTGPMPQCALYWGEAGWHEVRAVFVPDAADATYAETVSTQWLNIVVPHAEPRLTLVASGANGQGARPTAGDSVRVQWSLSGTDRRTPEGGLALSVSPADAVPAAALAACDLTERQGSCEVPLTVAGAAAPQVTFTAEYAGDVRFSATQRTATLTPRDCVVLSLTVEPAGAGTLAPQQQPNCGEPGEAASGFAEHTVVTFEAKPLPSGELSFDWVLTDPTGSVDTAAGRSNGFAVTPTSNWASVSFSKSYQCVAVVIDHVNVPGTTSSVRLPGLNGAPGTAPNCVYDWSARSDLRYQEGTGAWNVPTVASNTKHYSAWYLRGTELRGIELRPGQVDTKLYSIESDTFGGDQGFVRQGDRGIAPRTLTQGGHLTVTFGPSCYAAQASAIGPGTVTIENPENCAEPLSAVGFAGSDADADAALPPGTPGTVRSAAGTKGWFAGTVLRYTATPERTSGSSIDYVEFFGGTDEHPLLQPVEYGVRSVFEEHPAAVTETKTVRPNEWAPIGLAVFDTCHLVTLERGMMSNHRFAPKPPTFSTESNCGHPLAGEFIYRSTPQGVLSGSQQAWAVERYFDEGTTVDFETADYFETEMMIDGRPLASYAEFTGWQRDSGSGSWPADMARDNQRTQQLTVTEPRSFQPLYSLPDSCATSVVISSGDHARVTVSAELKNPLQKCNTGTLETGADTVLTGRVPGQGIYTTRDGIARAKLNGSALTFTAHVDEALNPIVGWELTASVTDPSVKPVIGRTGNELPISSSMQVKQATPGAQITMPLGFRHLNAKAVICQQLDYRVNMQREDGVIIENFENDDELVMAYPAPNCPFLPNAWTVGTTVELWAFGNPAGYTFTGWSGETEGAQVSDPFDTALGALLDDDELGEFLGAGFPEDGVTTFTMDGKNPVKRFDANYRVQCYDVTFESKKVESSTDITPPNCPGFESGPTLISNVTGKPYIVAEAKRSKTLSGQSIYDAGAKSMTARYIGGTEVVAVADPEWSDQVWLGWRGDVIDVATKGGKFNPANIVVDDDKHVINRYRDRTTGEEFEKLGNDIAIGMKKAVGFASIAVTDYLINYPPIGTVFMVADGLALMGTLLEMAGVDKDAIAWMSYPKQVADMLKAPLACVGTWALGASSGGAVRGAAGAAAEAGKQKSYRVTNITNAATKVTKQQAAMRAGDTGIIASAKLKYYQGKLGLAQLSKNVMPVASAGLAVYGVVQGTGVKWDKNADSAWTDFDAYTECIKKSVPSFLKSSGGAKAEQAVLDYAEQVRRELEGYSLEELTGFTIDGAATSEAVQRQMDLMSERLQAEWDAKDTEARMREKFGA